MKNYKKSYFFYVCLILLFMISCGEIDLNENGKKNKLPVMDGAALKLAIAPGGGVNAYTSLYSAYRFTQATGKSIYNNFSQFWGLSGGSIVAAMLMDSHKNNEANAVNYFISTIKDSYAGIKPIIEQIKNGNTLSDDVKTDNAGTRRNLFSSKLNMLFNKSIPQKVIITASADQKPVYYCHPSVRLPQDALRSSNSLTTAIINSSNFQPGILANKKGGLFKIVKDILLPDNRQYEVVDGFHARGSFNSPLEFAIDYLQTIRPPKGQNHKIVFFDNGNSINGGVYRMLAFENGNNGYYEINNKENDITIELYFLKIDDSNFNPNTANIENSSFVYRQNLVDSILNKEYFINAVNAFK